MRYSGFRLNWRRHGVGRWMGLVCGLLLSFFSGRASEPNYFIRAWQTDDGLPQNGVTAIVQSQDGYLWIGTYGGLARFDGVRFTVFNTATTPQMFSSRVTSLFEDSRGALWIGCEAGGLIRYKDGAFQSSETPFWNGRKVLAINEDQAGDIWALGADGSLLRVRGGLILMPDTEASSELGSLARDRSGRLWVFWNGKITVLEGNQLRAPPFAADLSGSPVQGICESRDGGLWIIAGGQVRKWLGDRWSPPPGLSMPAVDGMANVFSETRAWGLVTAVVDHGIELVWPDRPPLWFSRRNGLPSDWVRALCEDREGNLWLGTGNSLAVLRPSRVAVVSPPDQWQGKAVLSLSRSSDGALWAGTEGAGLYRFKDSRWSHFGAAEGLANAFVWSVSEDAQQRLWVGTWGGGLLWFTGTRLEPIPGSQNLPVPALAQFHAADGSTWLGTESGLVHYQNGKIEAYGRNKGLIYADVRAVVQDSRGVVWFGMLGGGLGVLKDGAVRQFRRVNGLSSDFVQCLKVEKDGSLWIGTSGGGLNRLKHSRFSVVGTAQGLPNDVICDIEDDGLGNFWVSSHGGVFRVRKSLLNLCADGLTNSVRCLAYGKGDGLPTLECSGGFQPAGCIGADGNVWFPTSKGIVMLDPNERNINHLPPRVIIEGISINNQPAIPVMAGKDPIPIPPGQSRLEFHYTGLSLVVPEKVRFKHRLEGLERDWIDSGTNRTALYSFIPPGSYRFRVIACNNDDVWNEVGQTLAITVEPRFWQEWWFRLLGGGALSAGIGAGVWSETRRRMRRKLERLERQRVVERERARIAKDIHDDLGASLTRITLLSQSVRGDLDNPARASSNLELIYRTARELTRAMDEIVWAVNPHYDNLDSLANYLGKFAQDFLGAAGIRCRLDLSLQLPAWALRAEVRHNLFLAFKEALHNTVKHAAASEVRITLTSEGRFFALVVEDNGRGFPGAPDGRPGRDNSRPARGNGLSNLRRRLADIGGRCDIESLAGQGVRVRFLVPCPPDQPEPDPGAAPPAVVETDDNPRMAFEDKNKRP